MRDTNREIAISHMLEIKILIELTLGDGIITEDELMGKIGKLRKKIGSRYLFASQIARFKRG